MLLVSCETATTSANKDNVNGHSQSAAALKNNEARINSGPVQKTARFIIRRSRPHAVTFNVVKASQTLGKDKVPVSIAN